MIKKTTTMAFAILTILGFAAGATFAQTATPSTTASPTPTTTVPEGAPSTGMAQ